MFIYYLYLMIFSGSRLSLDNASSDCSSSYTTSSDAVDNISLDAESELSSMTSISSDEVTVRTSKFEKRSSRVLDSIRELSCTDSNTINTCTVNRPHLTTENDLLNAYSNDVQFHDILSQKNNTEIFENFSGRHRTGTSLRRVETMPVQKIRILPRQDLVTDLDCDLVTDLDAEEFSIENSITGHIGSEHYTSVDYARMNEQDNYSDECSSSASTPGLSRQKSYKLAVQHLDMPNPEVIHL